MGLIEFLRQWQPGRLAAGVVASVAIHLAVVALMLWPGLPLSRYDVKRGEPLIVELPTADDSPPPGLRGAPVPQRSAPSRAAPPASPAPPTPPAPKAVAKPAPRPAEPARPAPRPEPERRVASAPLAKAPDGQEPAPAPSAPPKPEVAPPSERPPERPVIERTPSESAPRPERQVASVPQPSGPATPNILTALRGGQGGAGGSGQGRGGIEGEPIPLESTNPKYNDYLEQLRRMLQEKMTWPCDGYSRKHGDCVDRDEDLLLEFGIFKSGQLAFIELRRSSRQVIYDEYSANVIKLASPFPPLPAAMLAERTLGSPGVPILVHFRYNYTVDYRMRLVP